MKRQHFKMFMLEKGKKQNTNTWVTLLHKLPWFNHNNSFISKIMEISPLTSPSNGNRGMGSQGVICNLKPSQILTTVHLYSGVYALNKDLGMVLLSATRPPLPSSFQSFSFLHVSLRNVCSRTPIMCTQCQSSFFLVA